VTTDLDELEDLETLLVSPGWRRVEATFQQQWGRAGERYLSLLEKMANSTDRVAVADEIQRVIWVRREMEQFMASIAQRCKELRNRRQPVETSRRGGL